MVKGKSRKLKVLLELFVKISENKAYWDKWRTTEQWLELISATYPECQIFGFGAGDFNRALSIDPVYKHCIMQYGEATNTHGIHVVKYRKNGQRTTAIYCCKPSISVQRPPTDDSWWQDLSSQRVPSKRKNSNKRNYEG